MSGYLSPRGRPKSKVTSTARKSLFRDRRTRPCHYCGVRLTADRATMDHIRPLSKGGYDKRRNLVVCCAKCNAAKGRMSAGEFVQRRAL